MEYPSQPHQLSAETQAWLRGHEVRVLQQAASGRQSSHQEKVGRLRKAAIAGAGFLAIGGAVTGVVGMGSFEQSTAEAPHELELAGTLDMSEVSQHIEPADIERARRTDSQEFGMPVIQLSKYEAVKGGGANDLPMRKVSLLSSLPDNFQKKIDDVVAANSGILDYLVNTNNVHTIRFSMALNPGDLAGQEDGDMRFINPIVNKDGSITPAEIAYVLPPDHMVNADAAAKMIGHEAEHLVQLPLEAVYKSDEVKTNSYISAYKQETDDKAYAEDMAVIRAASISAAEADPKVQAAAERMIEANKDIDTPVAKAQIKIAQSLLDGTFNTLQPTRERPGKIGESKGESFMQEGRLNKPSFVEAIDSGLTEADQEQASVLQKTVSRELDRAFEEAVSHSPDSPYAALKESTYLETSEADGHPDGNFNEGAASSINIANSFPQRMAERLKRLPVGAKKATLSLVKRLSRDRAAVIDQHKEIKTSIGKEVEDKVDWIEREAA